MSSTGIEVLNNNRCATLNLKTQIYIFYVVSVVVLICFVLFSWVRVSLLKKISSFPFISVLVCLHVFDTKNNDVVTMSFTNFSLHVAK